MGEGFPPNPPLFGSGRAERRIKKREPSPFIFMNFLSKLTFLLKKPKIIIVTGNGRACAAEAIFQVLSQKLGSAGERFSERVRKTQKIKIKDVLSSEILIFPSAIDSSKEISFLLKNSSLPILVVTAVGEIPADKNFFAAELEKVKPISEVASEVPNKGCLVLNFDDETVREIGTKNKKIRCLTFGFQEGADCRASDIILNKGTNFKVQYNNNIVPVWLDKLFGKEQIYSALAAVCVGTILDINLVEISQALKSYQSLPGKMRLIEGIKYTYILDDSENASVYSMAEAVEILGKIKTEGRRIAVLGDILGIGKYTAEAHEAIGERVARNADLLFTIGARAKFIAQGALTKGMEKDKIFQFDEVDKAKMALQREMKKGDLVLIDGSKEMKMEEVVIEVRK